MGLLRTAARASVAAHVVGNVHRRQNQRWAAEDAAAGGQTQGLVQAHSAAPVTPTSAHGAPAGHAPATASDQSVDARLEQLVKLGQLRDSGILSPAEFEAQKQQILSGS